MASDLADRIQALIGDDPGIVRIRMFGGLCFMLNGNMLVGTMKGGSLLARVGEQQQEEALSRPGASLMELGGRQMKGYVIVAPEHLDDGQLGGWIATAKRFVTSLRSKPAKTTKTTAAAKPSTNRRA